MTHTPEPWKNSNSWIYNAGKSIGVFDTTEDGQRCVACVNAMAGITDPQAFRDSVDKLTAHVKEVDEIIRQKEERIKELENHILEIGSQM